MMAWLNTSGQLLLDESGQVILCDDCPCVPTQTCCPERAGTWPATLNCTITGYDDCACLSQSFTMNKISDGWYIGNMAVCDEQPPFAFSLTCEDNTWRVAWNAGCGLALANVTMLSCDPVHMLEESVPIENTTTGCCDGTIDIEITE